MGRALEELERTVGADGLMWWTNTVVAQEQTISGRKVTVNVEHYERAVIVTYNQMNINTSDWPM